MAKVLIVDDAAFMRGSLEFIVKSTGHEVVGAAKDGKEAIELYKSLKPDLVTLDILMKEVGGLKTLEAIMRLDPKAKVVMITALGQEEKQKQAERLGAKGYIRKPFKQTEIVEVIKKVLEKKGSE